MKAPLALSTMLMLIVIPGSLIASPADTVGFSACQDELRQYFGESAGFKLVSKRRSAKGTLLKIAVRQDSLESGELNVQFVTCSVASNGAADLQITVDGPMPPRKVD